MRLNEVIARLQQMQKEHGNLLVVFGDPDGADNYAPELEKIATHTYPYVWSDKNEAFVPHDTTVVLLQPADVCRVSNFEV